MATNDYHRYRIYCETEQAQVETPGFQDAAPTTCPNDNTHVVDLDSVVIVESKYLDAMNIVGLPDYTGRSLYRHSFLYEPVANEDQKWSESFAETLSIQGGEYSIVGSVTKGDYLEMMITDEDNVLGYGAGAVLKEFIKREYVKDNACLGSFMTPDASDVSSALYFTFRYVSTGTTVPWVIVRYNFRRVSTT